jgi:hypothetical protein
MSLTTTLPLAFSYLCLADVPRQKLQLVAAASMLIASKHEEVCGELRRGRLFLRSPSSPLCLLSRADCASSLKFHPLPRATADLPARGQRFCLHLRQRLHAPGKDTMIRRQRRRDQCSRLGFSRRPHDAYPPLQELLAMETNILVALEFKVRGKCKELAGPIWIT